MGRSKPKNRKHSRSANRGHRDLTNSVESTLDSERKRILVPVVHGIGTPSRSKWAKKSVTPLAEAFIRSKTKKWTRRPCSVVGCPEVDDIDSHTHLTAQDDSVEAELRAVYWSDAVPAPGWFKAMKWTAKTATAILLTHIVAACLKVVGTTSRQAGKSDAKHKHAEKDLGFRAMFLWFARFTALSLISVPVIVIATLSSIVMTFFPREKKKHLLDPMAWTADAGSRKDVIDTVISQIRDHRAEHLVLVGHSQGGAILSDVVNNWRSTPKPNLITLGSGQVILSVAHEVGDRKKAIGAILFTVLAVLYGIFALICILPMISLLINCIGFVVTSGMSFAYAAWVTANDLSRGLAMMLQNTEAQTSFLQGLLSSVISYPLAPLAVGVIFFGIAFMGASVCYKREIEEVIDSIKESRLTAEGVDISARQDYVSSPMSVMGNPERVQRIPMRGLFPFDHTSYFMHDHLALRRIVETVEGYISGGDSVPESRERQDGEVNEYSARLHGIGWTIALVAAVLSFSIAVFGAPADSLMLLLVSILAFVVIVSLFIFSTWVLLRRSARLPLWHLSDAWAARIRSRSRKTGVVILLVGIFTLGIQDPHAPYMAVLSVALIASAVLNFTGRTLAAPAGAISLIALGVAWLGTASIFGSIVGALLLAGALLVVIAGIRRES